MSMQATVRYVAARSFWPSFPPACTAWHIRCSAMLLLMQYHAKNGLRKSTGWACLELANSWGGLQVSMQAMVRCVAARSFWLASPPTSALLGALDADQAAGKQCCQFFRGCEQRQWLLLVLSASCQLKGSARSFWLASPLASASLALAMLIRLQASIIVS